MAGKTATPFVPKLRFPEFADGADWETKPLDKLAVRRTQRNFAGSKLRTLTNSAEFGVVDQRDYFEKDIATNTENYFVVETGDYVYNPRISNIAPVGPISKNRLGNGVMSPLYSVFRFQNDEHDFFSHFFASTHWHRYLRIVSNSGARHDRMAISNDDLMAMPLPLPPTEAEQQKIAECLGSLNDLIGAERRKLDALQVYKEGLMRQLFPRPERIQNGKKVPAETAPRLRFPEFQNAGEWRESTIGEIGKFYYGKSAPKWSLSDDAPTKCVRYGELYSTYGPVITETHSRTNIEPENLRFSKGGEILVPRVGEKPEDFGKCCSFLPLKDIAIGEMISVFETKQEPLFYTYYFRNLYREFARVVEGQSVKNLYYANLEPIAILQPSREEQKRIADCLWSLDQLFESMVDKVGALKLHKRGLHQRLFPTLEGKEP